MKTPPTVLLPPRGTPSPKALPPPAIPAIKRKLDSPSSAIDLHARSVPRLSPSGPESEPDEEALWAEARTAAEEERGFSESDAEPEVESSDSDDEPLRMRGRAMARLPNGDLHVCRPGVHCPFLVPNEDRMLVCQYTGIEHAPETTHEFFDLSNGLGQRTGDQDALCGEPQYGKWTRRADPLAASRAAFSYADTLEEKDTEFSILCTLKYEATPLGKKQPKRGALCVGEKAEEEQSRRHRSNKRNVTGQHACQALQNEAEAVLGKLINYDRASSFKHKPEEGRTHRTNPPVDPRMYDRGFVMDTSVKRYVRECMAKGVAPELDTLHNLSLMSDTISRKARDEAAKQESGGIRTAKFRKLVGSLVVALWAAMCATPYMTKTKRSNDAYRPYVCGVLYGMKRSVQLPGGGVLVPACPQLAAALPQLRGTGGNQMAKMLHSSAHRGLCTISRCIASVPAEQQCIVFGDVLKIAKTLDSTVFRSSDV